MFDKKAYYQYSSNLESISMLRFALLMIIFVVGGYLLGEYIIKNTLIGLILGVVVGIILLYINYLKEQIKVEEMRMMLEIHSKLTNNEQKCE